jgi:hypothetical protein
MAKSTLMSSDAEKRKKVILHEEDGKGYIETREDVDDLIDGAKIMADMPYDKDMYPVAVIPDSVLNDSFVNGWFHDTAKWKRWANNPDNKSFRIRGGQI